MCFDLLTCCNKKEILQFRKDHLRRLMDCLRLDDKIIPLKNRALVNGDEVLLFSLYRLGSQGRLYDQCVLFGREETTWSRAFNWFIDYIVNTCSHLVVNNLEYWKPLFPTYAEKIRVKMV